MPRKPRNAVITSETVHHVIARGNNRARIFHCDDDYKRYLGLLEAYAKDCGATIYHYCLMPNHVHLLLKADDLPLFMQMVQATYAKRYSRRYRRVGHIWSGRYKSPRIDTDAYLYACGNYIEMNPVRAKLSVKPENWKWSSYRTYAFGKYNRLVTLDPFYPTIAGSDEARQSRYRDLVDKTRTKR